MASENNFQTTVDSLFKGMNSFITTKTVVGEAVHIGDTIILPLVDVSFGVGASARSEDKKSGGVNGRQDDSQRNPGYPERNHKTGKCQESGRAYKSFRYGA